MDKKKAEEIKQYMEALAKGKSAPKPKAKSTLVLKRSTPIPVIYEHGYGVNIPITDQEIAGVKKKHRGVPTIIVTGRYFNRRKRKQISKRGTTKRQAYDKLNNRKLSPGRLQYRLFKNLIKLPTMMMHRITEMKLREKAKSIYDITMRLRQRKSFE